MYHSTLNGLALLLLLQHLSHSLTHQLIHQFILVFDLLKHLLLLDCMLAGAFVLHTKVYLLTLFEELLELVW